MKWKGCGPTDILVLEGIGKQSPNHERNIDFLLSVRLQPCKFDFFRPFDTTEKIVPLDVYI